MKVERHQTTAFAILNTLFRSSLEWITTSQIKKKAEETLGKSLKYPSMTAIISRIFKILSDVEPVLIERRAASIGSGFQYQLQVPEKMTFDELIDLYYKEDQKTRQLELASKEQESRTKKGPRTEKEAMKMAKAAKTQVETEDVEIDQLKEMAKSFSKKITSDEEVNLFSAVEEKIGNLTQIPSNIKIDITLKVLFGLVKE